MHPLLAETVHAVIHRGLELRERLQAGKRPLLDVEQAIFKDLLLAENEAGRVPDYGPDRERPRGRLGKPPEDRAPSTQSDFLGVRYALVCWLDELFTVDDSDWAGDWNEQKLEVELYGSNDRAWRFWQQAQLARTRTNDDPLEVFYLCVMLGFRGDLRDHDQQLRQWAGSARHRLGQVQEIAWPYASQLNVPIPARPLHGRNRLRRMILVASLTCMVMVPSVALLIIWRVGH